MSTAQVRFDEIEFHEGIKNPREELKDIDDLMASIRSVGLQVPLTVLQSEVRNGEHTDHYYLVVGFRRHEAIRRIRDVDPNAFQTVEVKKFKGSVAEAQVLNITENVQRSELSPLEVCRGVEILLNLGYKQKDVAEKIGKSQSWVSSAMQFRRQATPQLTQAVEAGAVSYGFARNIATLPDTDQVEQVDRLIAGAANGANGENGRVAGISGEPADIEEAIVRKKVRESSGRIIRPTSTEVRYEIDRLRANNGEALKDDSFALGILVALEWTLGERKTLQQVVADA